MKFAADIEQHETSGRLQTPRRSIFARHAAPIAAIVAAVLLWNRWLLDARVFFFADDWDWLLYAGFSQWNTFLHPLPTMAYNDRPMGELFVKALYKLVGLNYAAFQSGLLTLHAVNCVLLYSIATRYTTRIGALVAAFLAATWFSANGAVGWTAAIFDLLGATFCLGTVYLRQLSIKSGTNIAYDLAGAACYVLAIRTKEYALGTVAVLFLMNVLVEKRSLRATIRQLAPYLFVFFVYAARYGQLLATEPPPIGNPYHLDLSPFTVVDTLGFYVRTAFYAHFGLPVALVAAMVAGLGAGMLMSDDNAKRAGLLGMAGFFILLGPVLLLPGHHDGLYLYAPHFLAALAIGVLFARRFVPMALGVAIVAALMVGPTWNRGRQNAINWVYGMDGANRVQFDTAVKLLTPLAPGTAIFISGVESVFNPFREGISLQLAFKDRAVSADVLKPYDELAVNFCKTAGPKRFLSFAGTQGSDITKDVETSCYQRMPGR